MPDTISVEFTDSELDVVSTVLMKELLEFEGGGYVFTTEYLYKLLNELMPQVTEDTRGPIEKVTVTMTPVEARMWLSAFIEGPSLGASDDHARSGIAKIGRAAAIAEGAGHEAQFEEFILS